jgi:purine-binding chemotaxis protein CheW
MPEERTAADAEETKQFVIFRLGDEEFGMDVTNIMEIARITKITRVPHTPDFIEGIINLRTSLLACLLMQQQKY